MSSSFKPTSFTSVGRDIGAVYVDRGSINFFDSDVVSTVPVKNKIFNS